jgi:deoxycytidylate deaminase
MSYKKTTKYNKHKNNQYYNSIKLSHNKHIKYLDHAANFAIKSPLRWKYAAVIVNKNKIISTGYNHYIMTPFSGLYSTHAEIDALNNCKNKNNLKGAIMYVVHVNTNLIHKPYKYLIAAPCFDCEIKICKCMKKFGLSTIYYSTEML